MRRSLPVTSAALLLATALLVTTGPTAVAGPEARTAANPCVDVVDASVLSTDGPIAIDSGAPSTVTSTLVVSGAKAVLEDVDVVTNLTHSFSADIDMTVTSPEGTVVTLTTDNGAGNDNVFDGTLWDDDADPAGAAADTSSLLVTDHVYTNLVAEPTLEPEESLSAFVGENPNGMWTLTISDDLAGDGGTLTSWELDLVARGAARPTTTTTASSTTPVAITDAATTTTTLDVGGATGRLVDIDVTTSLAHTFSSDLDVRLISPAGTVVTLTTDNGGGNDDVFRGTVWDDAADPDGQVPYSTNDGLVTDQAYVNLVLASPLVPEESLGAFREENPNGTWTLEMTDDASGDLGTLESWGLSIASGACDTSVSGLVTSAAPKQKVGKKLTLASKVGSHDEALEVTVSGGVKIAGGKSFPLRKVTADLGTDASKKVRQELVGTKRVIANRTAAIKAALKRHKKVTATISFRARDELGNTLVVRRAVRLR